MNLLQCEVIIILNMYVNMFLLQQVVFWLSSLLMIVPIIEEHRSVGSSDDLIIIIRNPPLKCNELNQINGDLTHIM